MPESDAWSVRGLLTLQRQGTTGAKEQGELLTRQKQGMADVKEKGELLTRQKQERKKEND